MADTREGWQVVCESEEEEEGEEEGGNVTRGFAFTVCLFSCAVMHPSRSSTMILSC